MDKIPSSFEYCLKFVSSALEFVKKHITKMNSLIIDATNRKIFLMIIKDKNIYSVSHDNSKSNFEQLSSLIKDFLITNNLIIDNIVFI